MPALLAAINSMVLPRILMWSSPEEEMKEEEGDRVSDQQNK
jgi:hypothetical protein